MHRLHDLVESMVQKHHLSEATMEGPSAVQSASVDLPVFKNTVEAIRVKEEKTMRLFDAVVRQVTRVGIL